MMPFDYYKIHAYLQLFLLLLYPIEKEEFYHYVRKVF